MITDFIKNRRVLFVIPTALETPKFGKTSFTFKEYTRPKSKQVNFNSLSLNHC